MRIGTHSNSFHADDTLGVAILKHLHPEAQVVRSRSPEVWATCDVLVDVGGQFEPQTGRFDHHQRGFAEKRANGIPFAGAGLVWRYYGLGYVLSIFPSMDPYQAAEVVRAVDEKFVQYVDSIDNGIAVECPSNFSFSGMVSALNPTWLDADEAYDLNFHKAVDLAQMVLHGLVQSTGAEALAADQVRQAKTIADGRILVLERWVPFLSVVVAEMPQVLFAVYPQIDGNAQVRTIPVEQGAFRARADLPAAWAGLSGEALAKVSGVEDAIFCHHGRFIGGARSVAGALALAQRALADYQS